MAAPEYFTPVKNGRWERKGCVILKSFFPQAWSELNTGSSFWSNRYDHFTSSWPVCWPDHGVIIIKQAEQDLPSVIFQAVTCASHLILWRQLHVLHCDLIYVATVCVDQYDDLQEEQDKWIFSTSDTPSQQPELFLWSTLLNQWGTVCLVALSDFEPWTKDCWSQERTCKLFQTHRRFLGTVTLEVLTRKIT